MKEKNKTPNKTSKNGGDYGIACQARAQFRARGVPAAQAEEGRISAVSHTLRQSRLESPTYERSYGRALPVAADSGL